MDQCPVQGDPFNNIMEAGDKMRRPYEPFGSRKYSALFSCHFTETLDIKV